MSAERRAVPRDSAAARQRAATLMWVARIGAVTAEALALHEGATLGSARARLSVATRNGLLTVHRPLAERPALYTVTRAGLRAADLSRIEPARVSPASAQHMIACASVAAALELRYPDYTVIGERELRWLERESRMLLASAMLARAGSSARTPSHRPDLVLWPEGSEHLRPIAVEVELTIKAPQRLAEICRAWARAQHVEGVLYLAPPAVERALRRAIETALAADRITVVPLDSLTPEKRPK